MALFKPAVGVPVGDYVSSVLTRRPYKNPLDIEPVGDAVAIVTELRILQTRQEALGGTSEQREFVKMKLCDLLYSQILPNLIDDDSLLPYQTKGSKDFYNDCFVKFWSKTNRCLECYADMGSNNPRQLCAKSFCANVPY